MNRFRKRDRRQMFTLDNTNELEIKHFKITQKRELKSETFVFNGWNNDEPMKCFNACDIDSTSL